MEEILSATDSSAAQIILHSICRAMKSSISEFRMSSIGCLAFVLSQEIQRKVNDKNKKYNSNALRYILDTNLVVSSNWLNDEDNSLRHVLSSLNRLSMEKKLSGGARNPRLSQDKQQQQQQQQQQQEMNIPIGSEMSKILIHLLIAYNYAKSNKEPCRERSRLRDKDIIIAALANLLCISVEAKKSALAENLGETCLVILKESHSECTFQPYKMYRLKSSREKKEVTLFIYV